MSLIARIKSAYYRSIRHLNPLDDLFEYLLILMQEFNLNVFLDLIYEAS